MLPKKPFFLVLSIFLAACVCLAQETTPPDAQQPAPQPSAQQPGYPQQPSDTPAVQPAPTSPSQSTAPDQITPMEHTPVFRVNVVERTTKAVDYRDRGGTTQVDIKGTELEPRVDGWAKVTGHTGRLSIDADVKNLAPPRSLGPGYLTYVLWAIDSEGRPTSLGEIIPNNDGNARLQVTTALQEFGLVVTAEPYFAVSRPSDMVVAENIVRSDTKGWERTIDAKYQLLERGQYMTGIDPLSLPSASASVKTPLQILEAEDAIAVAKAAGADQYASDTLGKAQSYLDKANDYYARKQGETPIGTVARAATQAAEDARLISLEKKREEQTAAERQAAEQRIQSARTEAEAQTARADEARQQAEQAAEQRSLAEQERQAAEQARQEAEQARIAAEQTAQQLQQQQQQTQSQLQQAQADRQAAQLQAQQAEQEKERVEQQASEQRARLLQQLNQVLQTKDTAKGLIVNMSDVLFDTNQATLKSGAKLRLAKLAGIILAYPDLKLQIDGYTDSTGSQQFNQVLSERRAATVRDFLIAQGVGVNNVIAEGYGAADPVASNGTAAGRQQNRRVEVVVNGSAIGSTASNNPNGAGGISGATVGVNRPGNNNGQAQPAVAAPNQPKQNQTIPH